MKRWNNAIYYKCFCCIRVKKSVIKHNKIIFIIYDIISGKGVWWTIFILYLLFITARNLSKHGLKWVVDPDPACFIRIRVWQWGRIRIRFFLKDRIRISFLEGRIWIRLFLEDQTKLYPDPQLWIHPL